MTKLTAGMGSAAGAAVLAAAMLAGAAAPAAACGAVIFAWEEWEPFTYKGKDGKLTGLDMEVTTTVLEKAGCTIAYKEAPWARVLAELQSGDIDLTTGASRTEERDAFALFSESYRQETQILWVAKGKAAAWSLKTLEDLKSLAEFRLNVTRDYSYGPVWAKIKDDQAIRKITEESSNDEVGLKKLVGGRVQGMLVDLVAGTSLSRTLGVADQVERHPVPVNSSDIHVMFSKKRTDPAVIAAFNKALAAAKADGTLDGIVKKYIP